MPKTESVTALTTREGWRLGRKSSTEKVKISCENDQISKIIPFIGYGRILDKEKIKQMQQVLSNNHRIPIKTHQKQ